MGFGGPDFDAGQPGLAAVRRYDKNSRELPQKTVGLTETQSILTADYLDVDPKTGRPTQSPLGKAAGVFVKPKPEDKTDYAKFGESGNNDGFAVPAEFEPRGVLIGPPAGREYQEDDGS